MSFPRSHRLTTTADFKSLFDKSKKVSQRCLLVMFKKNQKAHARLGLIVAKRYIKTAVMRNKTKRVLRDSFRNNKEKLAGLDIIVIAKKNCGELNKQQLRKGIDQLWEKLLTYL